MEMGISTRLDAGEGGVKRAHVETLSAFNESLAPLFESDVCRMVETLDNVAYGTTFRTVDRLQKARTRGRARSCVLRRVQVGHPRTGRPVTARGRTRNPDLPHTCGL
jgi:hypothetical protein